MTGSDRLAEIRQRITDADPDSEFQMLYNDLPWLVAALVAERAENERLRGEVKMWHDKWVRALPSDD